MTTQNTTIELQSFHFAFQISRSIIFEVSYYRCGNNREKHFSTSANEFNRPKSDYSRCGQAQNDLLKGAAKAMNFFKKWDALHIQSLTESQWNELCMDLEALKQQYNFIENNTDNGFSFSAVRELSKQPAKRL